jgi:hypothetical protein
VTTATKRDYIAAAGSAIYLGSWLPVMYIAAYREILPTLWRQLGKPEYYVKRELPASARAYRPDLHGAVLAS